MFAIVPASSTCTRGDRKVSIGVYDRTGVTAEYEG